MVGSHLRLNSKGGPHILILKIGDADSSLALILREQGHDKVTFTQEKLKDFHYEHLDSYSCIVFAFADGASRLYQFPPEKQMRILEYLNNGGSVLWTHDHLDYTITLIPELERFVGFSNQGRYWDDKGNYIAEVAFDKLVSKSATINMMTHELFSCYNIILGSSIPISPTHTTNGEIIDGTQLCALDNVTKSPYLVVKEHKSSRNAYLAAGHTENFTLPEKKLFVNLIFWLSFASSNTLK